MKKNEQKRNTVKHINGKFRLLVKYDKEMDKEEQLKSEDIS